MNGDSFYLQCPSNASMHMFPNNKLSEYTIHLETPLEVGDAYEVGLCEIQYPQSWDNIRRGSNRLSTHLIIKETDEVESNFDIEIPPGYYDSLPELMEKVRSSYTKNKEGEFELKGLKMIYNKTTRRVHVIADKMRYMANDYQVTSSVTITLKDDVARALGLQNGTKISTGESIVSEFPATVTGGFHQMYVYTDIIPPQPHPDGNVSILRTIAIDGKPNQEYLSKRFQNVYYMPLSRDIISTISFAILDETGKRVGFNFGKVLLVLHFRKKRA